jgi:hypothetical protein
MLTDAPDYSKRYESRSRYGKMIYLATYKTKHDSRQPEYKQRRLLFIEADEGLALDKVLTLVQRLTGGDFDDSSVEIIARKDRDAANIRHPQIRLHKLR